LFYTILSDGQKHFPGDATQAYNPALKDPIIIYASVCNVSFRPFQAMGLSKSIT
jgi:hypothetical protein